MNSNILPTLQNNQDVFNEKHCGRFTASEVHKLLTPTVKVADNDTSRSYILQKAIEKAYGYSHDVFAKAMEHGKEFEPLAFNKFNEINAENFIIAVTSDFLSIDENSGATPDGIVSDNSCLEIKCPYDALNFFKLVHTGEIKKEYFFQIQMAMLAANKPKCHFFNYCVINGIEYTHDIIVEADSKIQEVIKEAIAEAVIKRDAIIIELSEKIKL